MVKHFPVHKYLIVALYESRNYNLRIAQITNQAGKKHVKVKIYDGIARNLKEEPLTAMIFVMKSYLEHNEELTSPNL